MTNLGEARAAFAERIRLQVQSRYRGREVVVDSESFCLRVTAPGIDVKLPLTPLFNACQREVGATPRLVAAFVTVVERQLVPHQSVPVLNPNRLLWCVRSRSYLDGLSRSGELVQRSLGNDIIAFVAEALPEAVMRGVPRGELEQAGFDAHTAASVAGENTRRRFADLVPRVEAIDRIPADGWRMSSDQLFMGSVMLVPEILRAYHQQAGGDILLALPDRGVILVLPADAAAAPRFPQRVVREWRESLNSLSKEVLRSDGTSLVVHRG